LSDEYISCPYCGATIMKNGLHSHVSFCPVLLTKRAMVLAPGRLEYEEGEVPEPAKNLIRRKGSLLTEVEFE